jgi:anti-sigma regulatory factor (Ser/Thr protein kinase)
MAAEEPRGPAVEHAATFPARMSALADVAAFTGRACAAAGAARDTCARLVLLIEELFVNTVAHGYGRDSDEPVRIALEFRPGQIALSYEDSAPAHDPFAAVVVPDETATVEERPVGGLGVLLVASMARDLQYRRLGGANRISIVMAAPG